MSRIKTDPYGLYINTENTYFRGQPSKKNQIGYCHNKSHLGYLSITALKRHQCLKKNCPYLEKYQDHEFWVNRDKLKEKKKKDKLNRKTMEELYSSRKCKKFVLETYFTNR